MSKSILLADDSATIRKVVELTFGDTDYHVESVGSGAEAMDKLEILRPDLVLADVVMPPPTGYDICRRIKASDRPVPVLLLAGTFETFDHEQARSCGADGCLLKPFEAETLRDRVTSLLAHRDAVTASAVAPFEEDEIRVEAIRALGTTEEGPVPIRTEAVVSEEPATLPTEPPPAGLEPETIEAIARAVVQRLSEDVVRQIAREVVPRVAEEVVRQRIRELEDEDS